VNLHEVLGRSRSDSRAGSVHEVHHHGLVTNEIGVETLGLAVLGLQKNVRESIGDLAPVAFVGVHAVDGGHQRREGTSADETGEAAHRDETIL